MFVQSEGAFYSFALTDGVSPALALPHTAGVSQSWGSYC